MAPEALRGLEDIGRAFLAPWLRALSLGFETSGATLTYFLEAGFSVDFDMPLETKS